jgi:hypothetical protein
MTDALTPQRFDAVLSKKTTSPLIWSAKSIGERIGRSESWVRKNLAGADGSPVRVYEGRLYAYESELLEFFGRV